MVGSQIEPVQALSEAVGDLTSLHGDMARFHDDQLMHLIVETTRSQHRLDAVRLAAIAELDERPIADDGGYTSTSAWLAAHTDVSWNQARGDVAIARALDDMPETSSALRDGDIDLPRVRRLASACADNPALFRRDEAILVEGARTMSGRCDGWSTSVGRPPTRAGSQPFRSGCSAAAAFTARRPSTA